MFPTRYFPNRFFTLRYWTKVGLTLIVTPGPFYVTEATFFTPGFMDAEALFDSITDYDIFTPGFVDGEIG